jgi:AcrR family transcriptional regulator
VALPDRALPGSQVLEIQRSRLLAAAVRAIDELGYSRATVAHITSRARVSRRTFYELFESREECLLALIEETLGTLEAELAAAGVQALAWRARVRVGLGVILRFFELEPALARVCVVQALRGGPAVLRRREQVLATLAAAIDEGRREHARGGDCSPLTAEGLVGAAFQIIYGRLLRGEQESLSALEGELAALILLPYLGPVAARREQTRPAPAIVRDAACAGPRGERATDDPLEGLAMRVTYRTARVLQGVAENPGASNRLVGERAGIHDPGQVSKLLSRLQRLGLLENRGEGHGKGEANAWVLTARGARVAQSIRPQTPGEREAA